VKPDKKISAIVVDDEPLARHGLRDLLEEEKDFTVVAESCDGEEAIRHIRRYNPDVVFLDIQMPEVNGFEVVNAIPRNDLPLIVFVTAYDEFAVNAFSANALDYILKPFDSERIHSTLHRVREMLRLKERASYSEKILEALKSIQSAKSYIDRIPVRNAGKVSFVSVDDLVWIEAAEDYITLHTMTGTMTTRASIGAIEKQLDPSRFVRIHRSTIVNLHHIKELRPMDHGEFSALLRHGTTLTVSRTYKKRLATLLE